MVQCVGGDRSTFVDLAPDDGILVGADLTIGSQFNGLIESLRPVFLCDGRERKGERYGDRNGEIAIVRAQPGYAIAGAKVRKRLWVIGIQFIFMRVDNDRLDPAGAYLGEWHGGEKGGDISTVWFTRPIIGVSGRAGNTLNDLTLIPVVSP